MKAGVAAGHPATADVGAEILADGGTAADAVVAMALASCVAETVMSGLLAGCHAIVFDGTSVLNLDGFAAVPAASAKLAELPVAFGDEIVVYAIGAASCAVPGLPAALGELSERFGRLPWRRLCEPALELARRGVPLPEMHERSLQMLGELFALERGAEIFTRDGRTLREGELLDQPGLVQTLGALADEGAASVYRGSIAEALLQVDGVVLDAESLASYRPVWREPADRRLPRSTRGDTRRPVGGPGAASAAPTCRRTDADGTRAGSRRRVRDSTERWRAHDEHGRRRLARPRVRAHALPRGRRRGVGARLRHAAEQPPRGVGHCVRRPAAGRPSREPDGPVARLRCERPRARDRLRRRDPLANGARDGCSPRSSTRSSTPRRRWASRAFTRPSTSSTPSQVSTRRRWQRSRRAAALFAAGIAFTTTSVASVASGVRAPLATRAGAARRTSCSGRYFSSSLSMRRAESQSPANPIAVR